MSAAQPEVSVIVPARNGAESLPALLTSLQQQTLERDRYELIVVDNDSSDDTAGVAERHGALVVHEPIANRSRARNRAAAVARAPLFAFTDADCVVAPDWLEQLLGCAHLAPLVAGDVRLRTRENPNAVERFELLWRFGQGSWVKEQGWAATANLLVRREAFHAVNGFDSSWRHIGEDADFCIRAGRAGYELDYCARAVVEHRGEWQLRPFLRRCFLHGYSANQSYYRLGGGYRAWRDPLPAVAGDRALRECGQSPERFEAGEWRRMTQMARLSYAARIAGSLWAEARHAR